MFSFLYFFNVCYIQFVNFSFPFSVFSVCLRLPAYAGGHVVVVQLEAGHDHQDELSVVGEGEQLRPPSADQRPEVLAGARHRRHQAGSGSLRPLPRRPRFTLPRRHRHRQRRQRRHLRRKRRFSNVALLHSLSCDAASIPLRRPGCGSATLGDVFSKRRNGVTTDVA